MRDQIAGERQRKYELLMRKRDEFVRDNTKQSIEKGDKKDRDRTEFLDYRPNFFPFTYGEEVESKRSKLRENQNGRFEPPYLSLLVQAQA